MRPGTTIVALLTPILFAHQDAFSQTASGVVNSYYAVTTVDAATNSVMVDESPRDWNPANSCSSSRRRVNAAIDATNTATYGNVTTINSAGQYSQYGLQCPRQHRFG